MTCCMRVSLASSFDSVSLGPAGKPRKELRHDGSLRHSSSGAGPAFCGAGGGSEYGRTPICPTWIVAEGWDRLRVELPVRVQMTICLETTYSPPRASSAALEERK